MVAETTIPMPSQNGIENMRVRTEGSGNTAKKWPMHGLDPEDVDALTAAIAAIDPATRLAAIETLLTGSLAVTGPLTNAQLGGAGLATQVTLEAVRVLLAGTLKAAPSVDQDPIFDHANGEKATVTATAVVFTPPAGCKFARFDATVDTFIRTDDQDADDDGEAIRLIAGAPEILPVTAGVAVRAYAASSSILRITPMKVR